MSDSDVTYHLHLNPTQARVLIQALDLYSRVGMRQLDAIGTVLTFEMRRVDAQGQDAEPIEAIQAARRGLDAVKQALGFGQGSSLSIRGAPEIARVAYDIQQVLRYTIAKQEKRGAYSVWSDAPNRLSAQPLPLAGVTAPPEPT